MPSPIGVIFLIASLYLFTKGSDRLFGLLVFSGIFQGASIISSGSGGLQPYYLVALFFLIRCAVEIALRKTPRPRIKGNWVLAILIILGVVSAFLFPHIFKGIAVNNPKNSDASLDPLQFSSENVVQACLLTVNGLVVFAAGLVPGRIDRASKMFLIAFNILLGIILVQMICIKVGASFPYALLNNNQNYVFANADLAEGYSRPNGTFSEPSAAGAALVAFALGALARYVKTGKNILMVSWAFIGVLIVASTSSFLAMSLGVILVLIAYPIVRLPYYLRLTRLKRLSFILLFGVLIAVALAVPVLRDNLVEGTVNKASSYSLVVRLAEDLRAVQIAYQTYGIGVGLGSNRPSSMIAGLLSTIGVTGVTLFIVAVWRLLLNDLGEYSWLKWGTMGLILSMAFGIPDLSFPLLWIMLALVVRGAQQRYTKENLYSGRAYLHPDGPDKLAAGFSVS